MKISLQILTFILTLHFLLACASGPSGLQRPNGVAVAPDGSLYVMDRGNNRVVHLSASGQFLGAFGRLGTTPADIYSGWDIDLDSAGNIYICHHTLDETGSTRPSDGVKVFSPEGRLLRVLGEQTYSSSDETPNTPYGLDIDSQGQVYMADFDAGTIRIFSAEGKKLAAIPGQSGSVTSWFKTPVDVAVDSARHLLYVVDPYYSRIQQFSLAVGESEPVLKYRLTIGSYGHEPGQFAYPQNIVVDDQSGRVYITDIANRRIQVFDSEGQFVTQMAAPGNWQALGLDLGPDGAIYATDAFNNVIWVFEPNGQIRRRIEVSS
jgi:DNA-binding beta-propeller fold protein YncE